MPSATASGRSIGGIVRVRGAASVRSTIRIRSTTSGRIACTGRGRGLDTTGIRIHASRCRGGRSAATGSHRCSRNRLVCHRLIRCRLAGHGRSAIRSLSGRGRGSISFCRCCRLARYSRSTIRGRCR